MAKTWLSYFTWQLHGNLKIFTWQTKALNVLKNLFFGKFSWQFPGKTKFRTWQNMAIIFLKLINFFLLIFFKINFILFCEYFC